MNGFAPSSADYTFSIAMEDNASSAYSWPEVLFRYSSTADTGYRLEMSLSAITLYRYSAGAKTQLTSSAIGTSSLTYSNFAIQVIGNAITVYRNATKLFTYTDSSGVVSSTVPGTVGLGAWQGGGYQSLLVEDKYYTAAKATSTGVGAASGVGRATTVGAAAAAGTGGAAAPGTIKNTGPGYLNDNFAATTAVELSQHQPQNGGLWVSANFSNDTINVTTSGYALNNNNGANDYACYFNRTDAVADSTVSLDYKVAAASSKLGVVFRFNEATKTGYTAFVDGNLVYLSKMAAVTPTSITSASIPAQAVGSTHNITATITGSNINVYVDGVLYISTTNTVYTATGYPGIYSYNNGLQIDRISATQPVALTKGVVTGTGAATGAGAANVKGTATAAGTGAGTATATIKNKGPNNLTDLFNDATGVGLLQHYPNNGGVWVNTGHTSYTMSLAGTSGYVIGSTSGASPAYYVNRTDTIQDCTVSLNFIYKSSGIVGILFRYSESLRGGYVAHISSGALTLAKITSATTGQPTVITSVSVPTFTSTTAVQNISVTAQGSTITVYFNGVNYISTTDTSFPNAGIPGIFTNANGYQINDISSSVAVVSANFATTGSGTASAVGSRFVSGKGAATGTGAATGIAQKISNASFASAGVSTASGDGQTVQGNTFIRDTFTTTTNTVLEQHTPDVGGAWYNAGTKLGTNGAVLTVSTNGYVAETAGNSYSNYLNRALIPAGGFAITFDGSLTNSGDVTGVSFCVDYASNTGYYLYLSSQVVLYKYSGGASVLGSYTAATPIYPATAHFEVDVSNGTINVYRNGTQVISYVDSAPLTGRSTGIRTYNTGIVDNFTASHVVSIPKSAVGAATGQGVATGAGGRVVAIKGTAAGAATTAWVPGVTKVATFTTTTNSTATANGLVLKTGYGDGGGTSHAQATSVPITMNPTTGSAAGSASTSVRGNGIARATASATGVASTNIVGRRFGQGEGEGKATASSSASAVGQGRRTISGTGTAAGAVAIEGRSDNLKIGAGHATGAASTSGKASASIAVKATGTSTAAANAVVIHVSTFHVNGTNNALAQGYPRTTVGVAQSSSTSTASGDGFPRNIVGVGKAKGTSSARVFNGPISTAAFHVNGTSTATSPMGGYVVPVTASATGTSTAMGTPHNYSTFKATGTSTAVAHPPLGDVHSGVGEADGTSTADGQSMSDGNAYGVAGGSAVGVTIQTGTGTATGTSTAQAVGSSIARAQANATGTCDPEAVGRAIATGTGSSTGSSTAQTHGGGIHTSAGSSTGSSTAQAVGIAIQTGAGHSDGTSTAQAIGITIQSSTGMAFSTSTAEAIGGEIAAAIAAAYGVSTASAQGRSIAAAVAQAMGTGSAIGIGRTIIDITGDSDGTSTAQAVGSALATAVFHDHGASDALGVATETASSIFGASGTSTAHGVGEATVEAVATAEGTSTAQDVGEETASSTAIAEGTSTASAEGFAMNFHVGVGHAAGYSNTWGTASTVPDERFLNTTVKAQPLIWAGEDQGAVRVDDWPNPSRDLKTVMIHTDDFVGVVTIQATLHNEPGDSDWFDIHVEPFVQAGQFEEKSRNRFFNSRDRFIWMRAQIVSVMGRVDRIMVI